MNDFTPRERELISKALKIAALDLRTEADSVIEKVSAEIAEIERKLYE